jgi:hypothetical protein
MTTPILDVNTASSSVALDFTRIFGALRASVVQQLLTVWYGMPAYRDGNVDDWLGVALPLVQAAEETSAVATTTYMQIQMQLLGSDDTLDIPDMSLVTGEAIRNGATPEEVYYRPFKEIYNALSNGIDFDTAVDYGAERLRQLVETDIQLTHTNTSRTLLSQRNDVVGFRRIPTGEFTCALCLVASTQRYHKLDLMPIHPGCDCRVAPIIGDQDPGQIVDGDFLEQIHQAVERQFGMSARDARSIDYRKIPIVQNHGEYGPYLAVRGQHFDVA